ncbi:lysine transporter LysE [Lonsdalea britannica]|uniref:LysE/ArgO family amino acid transporter n=1 Tax=Lonsdalea britannica TaxID=1082704 RepID=UPI000A1E5239|nr:LysE/ArgO family amino acid transporter [Lonsdalea britannica]OSN04482.1 lysine transporter LysE [Lonsdalea britannica]
MSTTVFMTGLMTSAGLLMSIGAQNSFVLRQGVRREHVFLVCTLCFIFDIIFMSAGVFGVSELLSSYPWALKLLTLAGVLFLIHYGFGALRSAWRGNQSLRLGATGNAGASRRSAVTACLAVSLLNPSVYLDTIAIIGGISSGLSQEHKTFYLFGALLASGIWFYAIGYLSSACARLFNKSSTWRVLDSVIGVYMLFIAWQLLRLLLSPAA